MIDRFVPSHPVSDADRLAALDAYDVLDTAPERAFDGIVLLARTLYRSQPRAEVAEGLTNGCFRQVPTAS